MLLDKGQNLLYNHGANSNNCSKTKPLADGKKFIKKDKILKIKIKNELHYVKKHKNGKINDDEYFNECVKAIKNTWAAYDEE